jgi:hypothetical protein
MTRVSLLRSNPGLVSEQPFRAAGLHAVESHRGSVNSKETHAVGVRGEIGGSATAPTNLEEITDGLVAGVIQTVMSR